MAVTISMAGLQTSNHGEMLEHGFVGMDTDLLGELD